MELNLFEPITGEIVRPCRCPQCNSDKSTIVFTSIDRQFPSIQETFFASRCQVCGLLYQNPRVLPDALLRHYPDDYIGYNQEEISVGPQCIWHLKNEQGYTHLECNLNPTPRQKLEGRASSCFHLIPDYSPGQKVLEIGCGAGNRLALFKRLGWDFCIGNEYSESAAAVARSRGLDVIVGPLEEMISSIPEQSLAAIVGGFILEHLAQPFNLIRQLAGKLKSGGQILLSTINIESPDFWLYKAYWYDLDLPRHMVFFRKQDLRAMLEKDFKIEKIVTDSSLNDYLGSARYRVGDGVGGWRKLMDTALLRLNTHLRRPLSYLARAGFGARIYVIARKI